MLTNFMSEIPNERKYSVQLYVNGKTILKQILKNIGYKVVGWVQTKPEADSCEHC
jgi:hypothetical protein